MRKDRISREQCVWTVGACHASDFIQSQAVAAQQQSEERALVDHRKLRLTRAAVDATCIVRS